jgi:hypothetical protein
LEDAAAAHDLDQLVEADLGFHRSLAAALDSDRLSAVFRTPVNKGRRRFRLPTPFTAGIRLAPLDPPVPKRAGGNDELVEADQPELVARVVVHDRPTEPRSGLSLSPSSTAREGP